MYALAFWPEVVPPQYNSPNRVTLSPELIDAPVVTIPENVAAPVEAMDNLGVVLPPVIT